MPFEYRQLEPETAKKLDKLFGVDNALIEIQPGNCLYTPTFKELGDRIENFNVRPDDVWLISYPRTGSNWAQEMVWCMLNDLDYEGAKIPNVMRYPLLELTAVFGNDHGEWKQALGNSIDMVENLNSPRCVKTHLPWGLLPKQIKTVNPKIIYVARNPKDVSVSYYHYCKLFHGFIGTFEDFCELFLKGKAPVGSIWEHVAEYWKRRNEPNVLILKFEEMKKDILSTIMQVSKFLGKEYSDMQVNSLIDHLSFSNMRKNPAINLEPLLQMMHQGRNEVECQKDDGKDGKNFLRKGQVGDWKNYLTDDDIQEFEKMNQKMWAPIGLEFSS